MMSSDCPPMMSDLSSAEHLRDVILRNINISKNANKRLLELIPNGNSELMSGLTRKPAPGNVSNDEIHRELSSSKLKKGDIVYIITFVDVHRIYVRNVKDDNNEFQSFTKSINSYCSTAKSIRKVPKLNDIVGAKFKIDKLFYRAKILKKIDVINYRVQFIDYGNEEMVKLSNMVSLPNKFLEIPSKISLVKLKDVQICKLNKDACAYVDLISDYKSITIDYIQDDTNDVILKTSTNQNINSHLNTLIFGNNNNIKNIGNDKSGEKTEIGSTSALITKKLASTHHNAVHGPRDLVSVPMTEAPATPEHDFHGPRELASVSTTEAPVVPEQDVLELFSNVDSASMSKLVDKPAPASPEHDVVHRPGEKLSVSTRTESSSPPATSFVITRTESPAPPVMTSVGTMTKSPAPPVTSAVGTMSESPAIPVMSSVGTMTKSPAPPVTSTVSTMSESPAPPVMSSVGTMSESPASPVTSSVSTMTESPAIPVMSSVGTMTESLAIPVMSSVGTMTKTPAPPVTSTVGTMSESPTIPVMSSVGTMTKSPAPPVTSTVGTMSESPAPPVMSSVGTMTKSSTSRWKRFKKLCRGYFRRFSVS